LQATIHAGDFRWKATKSYDQRRIKMNHIKTSSDYRDFMKGFLARDDIGQVSPPDSFDILIENQGRWKAYRFAYESETKWCATSQQAKDIVRKNRHCPQKQYAQAKRIIGPTAEQSPQ
jgi:hypothetical protein